MQPDRFPFHCFFVFLMWTIFKVFIEFVTIWLLFCFWFFDHEACGMLVPGPGVETVCIAFPLHWKTKS